MLYSSEFSLHPVDTHLRPMHCSPYVRLSEPGVVQAHDKPHPQQSVNKALAPWIISGNGPAQTTNLAINGPGVFDLGKVKIEFSIVSDRGECQLPNAFYQIKQELRPYFRFAGTTFPNPLL